MPLSLQRAGTGMEALEQPRLSSREMQQTAVRSCTHAHGSLKLGRVFFFMRCRGETRHNFIIHCSSKNCDFADEQETRRGRTGQQTTQQAVQSQRMIWRRAARQTEAVLQFFAAGDKVLDAFFYFFYFAVFVFQYTCKSSEKYF